MKQERTTNGTPAKLESMSYGQTVASKEQRQCTGSRGREARRRGLDMGRDREGAHGWTGSWKKKMNGAGKGEKKEKVLEKDPGQVNNKLNGNKINETGYKRDWEKPLSGPAGNWKIWM